MSAGTRAVVSEAGMVTVCVVLSGPACTVQPGSARILICAAEIVADPVSILIGKCMGSSADAGAAVPAFTVAAVFNTAVVSIVITVYAVVKRSTENACAGSGNSSRVSLRSVRLSLGLLPLISLPAVSCREDGCSAQSDQQ